MHSYTAVFSFRVQSWRIRPDYIDTNFPLETGKKSNSTTSTAPNGTEERKIDDNSRTGGNEISPSANVGDFEQYASCFRSFIEPLRKGIYDKLVLSRRVVYPGYSGFSPEHALYEACRRYVHSYVYLCYTPQTGVWLGSTPEMLLSGEADRWNTVALAGTMTSPDFPGKEAIGECAPLPDLSCDALPDYEDILVKACRKVEEKGGILEKDLLRNYPSILFGLEMLLRQWRSGSIALWNTPFSRGEAGIPINGLIWMGDYRQMLERIEEKMQKGFRCIKLKIGAIRFEEELELLRFIRQHYSSKEVELRVDANGAFSPIDALEKLNKLAELDLHSIEQPIRAGQWEEMSRLCAESPLPIALDEELIGVNEPKKKQALLDTICPQYLILKPSLHAAIDQTIRSVETG